MAEAPDFDALEDDQAAPGQGSVALSPPGPILSPNDPRYGRPAGPPVYSAVPQGPVMSPDDPRYGRPAGPPAVIYSDRPGAPPQPMYSDRGDGAVRPPEAIGTPGAVTGSVIKE